MKKILLVLALVSLAVPSAFVFAQNTGAAMPQVQVMPAVEKCGVNSFYVANDCGVGAFKNAYFQCYDGYEEKQGETSSCKTSETWQEYARAACANRCGSTAQPQLQIMPRMERVEPATETMPSGVPVSVCVISDDLSEEYSGLIAELQKAEAAGDKAVVEAITRKIIALKEETNRNRQNCQTTSTGQQKLVPPSVITIDRCAEAARWQEKLEYYRKISGLNEAALKNEYGFSREEINRILGELESGLEKVKAQCSAQSNAQSGSAATLPQVMAEPMKPVAAQSAQEINTYYKEKLQAITGGEGSAAGQILEFKALKEEKNLLTEQLIKSRKEIEATELNALEKEVQVTSGQIKAGDVIVDTTGKKVLFSFGVQPVSIEPMADRVLIKEKIEIRAENVSIEDNKLKVGQTEVKMLASDVAEKNGLAPTAVELKEENAKAVYEMAVSETRKLFGFISFSASKTVTADAANGDVLREQLPWYSFLTTK